MYLPQAVPSAFIIGAGLKRVGLKPAVKVNSLALELQLPFCSSFSVASQADTNCCSTAHTTGRALL